MTRDQGCLNRGRHRSVCVADCARPASQQVSAFTTASRLVRFAVVLAVGVPAVLLVVALPGYGRQRRRSAALGWISRRVLRALDVDLQVSGEARSGASLVVANHTSWLDVVVLAAGAPMVPVAKVEVADWPVVGVLARRCGAIFLRRDLLRELPACVDQMADLLRRGHRVQIFPEATTRCGLAIGEFHRAGFQAALDAAVVVQPAALRYSGAGADLTTTAFVGDDTLAAALWRMVAMPPVTATLQWLPPVPAIAGTGRAAVDRATVTRLCQNAIARSLDQPVVLRRRVAAGLPNQFTSTTEPAPIRR